MGQANHHNGPQNGTRESARTPRVGMRTETQVGVSAPGRRRSLSASPREVPMGAQRYAVVFFLSICGAQSAWAGDPLEAPLAVVETAAVAASTANAAAFSSVEAIEPWIHPSTPVSVRHKLETAFDLAIDRVSAFPECAALFEELGADPFDTLKTGLYFPANVARETSVCGRSFAQTNVGAAPTWICRRITSYSDEQAAMVVIHEALHHAGLPERPHDKKAMTSGQINDMVREACGL
jgi:hypothetical protein